MDRRYLYLRFVLVSELISLFVQLIYFIRNSYLPSPFIYDVGDTFMDFFHPLYHLMGKTEYTVYHSVYLPAYYLILKGITHFITIPYDYDDGFELRDKLRFIQWFFIPLYMLVVYLAIRISSLWIYFSSGKFLLYFSVLISPVYLFAFERGNSILLIPLFISMLTSRMQVLRYAGLFFLVSLKIYCILFFFPFIAKSNKPIIVSTILTSSLLGITTVSGLILGDGWWMVIRNIIGFSSAPVLTSIPEVLSYPSSVEVYERLFLKEKVVSFLSDYGVNSIKLSCIISVLRLELLSLIVLSGWYVRSRMTYEGFIVVCSVIITNVSLSVGGYSLLIYIPLIPFVLEMRNGKIMTVLMIIMLYPLDLFPILHFGIGQKLSYLSMTKVDYEYYLGIGQIFRPLINFILALVLLYELAIMAFDKKYRIIYGQRAY